MRSGCFILFSCLQPFWCSELRRAASWFLTLQVVQSDRDLTPASKGCKFEPRGDVGWASQVCRSISHMRARMQWNGRRISSKRFIILEFQIEPAVLVLITCTPARLVLFCLAMPHCFDSLYFNAQPPERHMCTSEQHFSWLTALVVIHQSITIQIAWWVAIEQTASTPSSRGWSWRTGVSLRGLEKRVGRRRGEGKRGDDEDSMCLQSEGFVCGVSGGVWRARTGVKPRSDPQIIKAAAQVLKNCSVSSGLVLIKASLRQSPLRH